jgi:hypothetical protein
MLPVTSSQAALIVAALVVFIAALILTSAQTRVLRRPRPRRTAYIVAGFFCTAIIAGLLIGMDSIAGVFRLDRTLGTVTVVATVVALSLAAGEWWLTRARWAGMHGAARFLILVLMHWAIVFALTYPFR